MADLNPSIFNLEVTNHELIKLAYDAYLANSRSSHAKTLKRGEVRGGKEALEAERYWMSTFLSNP